MPRVTAKSPAEIEDEAISCTMLRQEIDPDAADLVAYKRDTEAWRAGFLAGAAHALLWADAQTPMASPTETIRDDLKKGFPEQK